MKNTWHLTLMLLIAVAALAYEGHTLWHHYLRPAFYDERGFIEDFQYYYDAANHFFASPDKLYQPFGRQDDFAFIYPPICILGFLPLILLPLNISYVLWIMAGYVSLFAALYLSRKLLTSAGLNLKRTSLYTAFIVTAATGPIFTNATAGNVNTILLLLMIASIFLVYKNKAWTSGFVLSLAIWLKVYPVLLAPLLLLFATKRTHFIVGLVVGMVLLPAAFLPVVPCKLYSKYLFDVLPMLSGHITLHAFNQSLAASIGRFFSPYSAASSWGYPDTPSVAKALGYAAGLITLILAIFVASKNNRRYLPVSSFMIIAVVPIVTPFGWGYVFALSLPLFAYILFVSAALPSLGTKILTVIIFLMLLIPSWRLSPFADQHVFSLLFYMRYPVAVLLLLGMAVWSIFGQQSASLYRGFADRSTPESEP